MQPSNRMTVDRP